MINMYTLLDNALTNIKEPYRKKIRDGYLDFKKAIRLSSANRDYTSAGIKAGIFCEIVLRYLQDQCGLSVTSFDQQIHNFGNECRAIIESKASVVDGIKKIIPRVLVMIYSMRGNRGIGHVGGDVDANQIDSGIISKGVDWIMAEIIRVYHKIPLEDAQSLIDSMAEKSIPAIWPVNGKKRVLIKGLSAVDQTLIILYTSIDSAVLVEDLNEWIEYGSVNRFKNDIARRIHARRLAEFDVENNALIISPIGISEAEKILLSHKMY